MIAKKLIELRTNKKESLTKTAEEIGISTTVLFYLESGRNKPTSDTIKKICEYYQVSSDWLLDININQKKPIN